MTEQYRTLLSNAPFLTKTEGVLDDDDDDITRYNTLLQRRRKQFEAAGAAVQKGHIFYIKRTTNQ